MRTKKLKNQADSYNTQYLFKICYISTYW